jgi:DNA-binding protein HU-beta
MTGKGKGSDLTSLPGVGAATAKKLQAAKLGTVAIIAKASVGDLKKAGLTLAIAKKVHAAAKAANTAKATAGKAAKKASDSAKKVTSKAKDTSKKAGQKAAKASSKAGVAAKEATKKAVGKGQKLAEKVVEKTKAAGTSLKTAKDKDRKGETIKVPKSVKDMPWFKKK